MDEDVLYSASQVALILKVHQLTVRRYIKEGKLKAVKVGGNIRIPRSSLDAFSQNIYPTSYSMRSQQRSEVASFTPDDAIFRLKGKGLSLKGL
jgi:excisionase family DNA binding protein